MCGGNYCTTGMCPGDDRPYKNNDNNNHHTSSNHDSNNNHNSNDNHKSSNHHDSNSCCYDSSKGFDVNIVLDNAQPGKYQVRVIVYGVNTLNKPTLDKPGMTVSSHCVDCRINAGTWSFTDWKVQNGDRIKACAIELETRTTSCDFGVANKGRTDTIHVQLPGDVGD